VIINIAGYDILIDDEDFEKVNAYKWHCNETIGRKSIYFAHTGPRPKHEDIKLHRFIMNAPNGTEVDHVNCNTLDNRKVNLRLCSHQENSNNRLIHQNNKCGFKGVHYDTDRKKYRAQIQNEGKKRYLGLFDTPEEAHKAYCDASKKYHGEFGRTE
jgi:hypothetical protein